MKKYEIKQYGFSWDDDEEEIVNRHFVMPFNDIHEAIEYTKNNHLWYSLEEEDYEDNFNDDGSWYAEWQPDKRYSNLVMIFLEIKETK